MPKGNEAKIAESSTKEQTCDIFPVSGNERKCYSSINEGRKANYSKHLQEISRDIVCLLVSIPPLGVHGTVDSTSLIVTEHEFLFQFFNLDQSFSQSDQSGIAWAMYWNTVDEIENENNQKRKLVKLSTEAINFPLQQHTFNIEQHLID